MITLFAQRKHFRKQNVCCEQLALSQQRWHTPHMGFRIKELRKDRGLTIDQLADLSALSRGYLSQLETGKRQPSAETLGILAQVFGLQVPDLYETRSATEEALLSVFRRIPTSRHQELIRMLEIAAIPPDVADP